jgi:hypothetical protein
VQVFTESEHEEANKLAQTVSVCKWTVQLKYNRCLVGARVYVRENSKDKQLFQMVTSGKLPKPVDAMLAARQIIEQAKGELEQSASAAELTYEVAKATMQRCKLARP